MPDGMKFHLLPVTNAQWHIKIQVEGLSVSYPKIMHITCIVNALHRVYKTIHVHYINLQIQWLKGRKSSLNCQLEERSLKTTLQTDSSLQL
jgi:hypothetical protein